MKRNNFLSRFIVVTLTAALLLVSGSRAYRVSALADPVQAVAPVFDTQIYQLQDYIDHGGLGEPQLDIFYIMAGIFTVAQSGSQAIKLNDPFQNEDGVWNWFKSLGVRTYNSLINLLPDTARMPITGEVFSTIPFKNASAVYVASLMGMALEAKNFDTVEEFKQAVSSGSYYLPWNFDIQKGMNSIFGIYGGIYEWQFDSSPFQTEGFVWRTTTASGVLAGEYVTQFNSLGPLRVKLNHQNTNIYNCYFDFSDYIGYDTLFINENTGEWNIYKDASNFVNFGNSRSFDSVLYYDSPASMVLDQIGLLGEYFSGTIDLSQYDTFLQAVHYIFNSRTYPLESIVNHVYIGTNWLNKREIFNLTDLNFADPDIDNDIDHYYSVPDNTNYLLDIHNLVRDILNNTDLFQIVLNHIVDLNGVAVHDDQLIRVTTSIYELLKETNPVLPVNLNDISELTDNTYLDIVKERATAAGSTLANLVAFWHNCDFELVYVFFGAGITVLIGAFIGKWGHS